MAKISTDVEFYQGSKGPLFRLIRTPEQVHAHLLFIPPLFEQANQTRHHITRSAINAYQQGIKTIVFDHYGTGDSAGELIDANLLLWQHDVIKQLADIKTHCSQPIYLSLALSAALILTDEMLAQVDGLILLQPDFNGKRFVQQFKRLALAAELSQADQSRNIETQEHTSIEIAGYQIKTDLLAELAEQNLEQLTDFKKYCYWFEWQGASEELSQGRMKQQQALSLKNSQLSVKNIDDVKFWQATELKIAKSYLKQEQLIFSFLGLSVLPTSKGEVN